MVQNLFRTGRHVLRSVHHRLLRTRARGAMVVVPPIKTANVSRRGLRSPARDRTITNVATRGRRRWQKESGYHRQARVENTFFRYKSIIGDRLRAWSPSGQASEGHCGQVGSAGDEAVPPASASDTRHLTPDTEGLCSQDPIMEGPQEVATDTEEILNGPMHREKPLRVRGGFEPAHLPFPLRGRLVGDCRPVVRVMVRAVDHGRHHGSAGR